MTDINKIISNQCKIIESSLLNSSQQILATAELISKNKNKLFFCGMGKAGLIAQKSAATTSSIGIPSFYIHPSEALHGDIGSIEKDDICILFSNSGETDEILLFVNNLRKNNNPIIAITGNSNSSLALAATITIDIGKIEEICHLKMAPTTSTTIMMMVGDLIATQASQLKGFDLDDYAKNHPLGSIGKKMLKVKDIMRTDFPRMSKSTPIKDALLLITKKNTGSVSIIDENNELLGIFTDGDLRRHFDKISIASTTIGDVMTSTPKSIGQNEKVIDVAHKFTLYHCDEFPVVDENNKSIGLLDIQDLVEIGITNLK
ncbi:MAG: hypothetical protein COA79_20565 [Planctomycetota bacterium]|nr:MAG: hypothetical protein COA79_20565 [Planctomycetota bacterium]